MCVFIFGQHLMVGLLNTSMHLTKLTRKHSIKIAPAFSCSVEDCSLAVGQVVGHSKSAAQMNSAVVIFVDGVEHGGGERDRGEQYVCVCFASRTPAKKVTVSNVPPFISDEILTREFSRHGKIVSQIRKVPSGCKSPQLKHVVSHRRQLHLILNNRNEELSLVFKLKVDDFDYVIFATSDSMKCFSCDKEGQKNSTSGQNVYNKAAAEGKEIENQHQNETETMRQDSQDSVEGQEETGEVQQDSQMSEGGQEVVKQKENCLSESCRGCSVGRK